MARKRKANVPKTSVRGKKIKEEVLEEEKVASPRLVETVITPDLKYDILGSYQKKITKEKKSVETIKTNINRRPLDGNTDTSQVNKDRKERDIIFTNISEKNNNETVQSQIKQSPVASAVIHIKEQDCNTISDITSMQSQVNSRGHKWTSLVEKVTLANDATINMLERYVKNTLFYKVKFISSPQMLMFNKDTNSICQVVCSLFNATGTYQMHFWSTHSKYLPRFLNKKRADVSNGMKKQFQGK